MDNITIAVESAVDPMTQVMDCLFRECEVLISDKILDVMKKFHSYTKMTKGKVEKYTFHRRTRGTDALFSFVVTTGMNGNKVSDLECIAAELGLMGKQETSCEKTGEKVYVIFKEE